MFPPIPPIIVNAWRSLNPNREAKRSDPIPKLASLEFKRPAPTPESARARADELSRFFPLLLYRKKGQEAKAIDALKAAYHEGNVSCADGITTDFLSTIIFDVLQALSENICANIDLKVFNQKQAQDLAKRVWAASPDGDYNAWYDDYDAGLDCEVRRQLSLIKGKEWKCEPTSLETIESSFSHLWKNKQTEKLGKLLREMADAHAIIQATSCSTQNENSFLACFDAVNYVRSYKQIAEFKYILFSLLQPFKHILYEYRDIALYTSSSHYKFLRMMMPILVPTAFLIFVSSVLTETAFWIALIPALIVGLALASQYIWLKNYVYTYFHEWDGPYNVKEFEVNERMRNVFKSQEAAEEVRHFYVTELERCDTLNNELETKRKTKGLEEGEHDRIKENLTRRDTLCLEWFDIHSNENMPTNIISKFVLAQVEATLSIESKKLKEVLQAEEKDIQEAATYCVNDIWTTLQCPIYTEEQARQVPLSRAPRFFTPSKTLSHKATAERMYDLSETLKH